MIDGHGYDPADNSRKCHALAIRELRLEGVRSGRHPPNLDDPEEMRVARESGLVVDPVHHRRSA